MITPLVEPFIFLFLDTVSCGGYIITDNDFHFLYEVKNCLEDTNSNAS